jgi:hypothetical protein
MGKMEFRLCAIFALASVSTASAAYSVKTEFNLRFVEPPPAEGYYETWEKLTLNVICDWTVTIEGGTASEFPLSPVRASLTAGPGETLLKFAHSAGTVLESYNTNVAQDQDAIPKGTYPNGTILTGTLKGQIKADRQGAANVACGLYNPYGIWYTLWRSPLPNDRPIKQIQRTVYEPEPLDSLRLPTPIIQAPVSQPGGEVVIFPTDSSLVLRANIVPFMVDWTLNHKVAKRDFVEMCKFTKVFVETWHMQILRKESSGMFMAVADFTAPVTSYERLVQLAPHFFDKYGTGVWRLKTWISQDNTPSGTVSGAASTVDFELRAQAPTALLIAPRTPGSASVAETRDTGSTPLRLLPSVLVPSRSSSPSVESQRSGQTDQPTASRSTQGVASSADAMVSDTKRMTLSKRLFELPAIDGKRVDFCLHWGSDCGQPAADAFCQKSGYAKAVDFQEASNIGAQAPTLVLGDGKLCSYASCDGFAAIRCSR